MNLRRVLVVLLAVAVTLGVAPRSYALLGIGDVVFDPSVYAQAIQQVIRLERQYEQLVQSYQMLRNQYEQMVRSARRVPVDMTRRYRTLETPWRMPHASDVYGQTGAWTRASSTGIGAVGAFAQATERLSEYGALLDRLSADAQRYAKTSYGTVELTDDVTQGTLETVGRLRGNARSVQEALTRLEDDSLSSAPEMNSEVAVLNKINAASVIGLRTTQDTNSLLVTLAEQQAVAAKRTRDAEARAIAQHIRFLADAKPLLDAQAANATRAMRAWRMP